MSAEMVPYEPQGALLATVQDAAIARLGEWARSADAAYKVAGRLVESAFCPAQFRGKAVEATAAILAGIEVGMSPMAAMRAFDIIQGQAAPKALTLRAIVQSHGHSMVLVESTDTRCRMKGRRRGEQEWQAVTWTLDRAKALGLVSKDNWKKQPGAMLVARATSELARLIASDAILGIAYSAEEINDGGTYEQAAADATVTPPTETGTRRIGRAPRAAAEPAEPDLPADVITEPQRRKMQALYHELGTTDRDERLADTSQFIGRDIATSNDLTRDEAGRLIDWLEMRRQGPDTDNTELPLP